MIPPGVRLLRLCRRLPCLALLIALGQRFRIDGGKLGRLLREWTSATRTATPIGPDFVPFVRPAK